MTSTAALWGAVVFSGFYHGLNPGMGWPLAVSAALMDRNAAALPKALAALAIGHLASMLVILLPFTLMTALIAYEHQIRITAAFLVIGLGIYLLINRRHPRFLSRVSPDRLALWSFLAALAHGAGLMLLPIYLGICRADADTGHQAAFALMQSNLVTAFVVAMLHTAAMTLVGGALAAVTYKWMGLRFLKKSWFNLDIVWASSLILVGVLSLVLGHG